MITAKYQKIDGRKYRKIFVVGDLHGCFSLLEKKMNEVGFDKEIDLADCYPGCFVWTGICEV